MQNEHENKAHFLKRLLFAVIIWSKGHQQIFRRNYSLLGITLRVELA